LQKLGPENTNYALALISGASLDKWHDLPEWRKKIATSKSKSGAVIVFNDEQKAIWRMADTAFQTTENANGQEVKRTVKVKNMEFLSKEELQKYIGALLQDQEKICALTDLPLNLMEREGFRKCELH
jgi:hypothetical protein